MLRLPYIPNLTILERGYENNAGVPVVQTRVLHLQVPLTWVYHYIRGTRAKAATEALRAETDKDKQARMKVLDFLSCTPNGTFWYRDAKFLIQRSGMMVIDLDDIPKEEVESLKQTLIHDSRYETELLFTSPRGSGLKWLIGCGDCEEKSFKEYYQQVSLYLRYEYGLPPDESGKDIARCCFLSHDPNAYINPNFIHS